MPSNEIDTLLALSRQISSIYYDNQIMIFALLFFIEIIGAQGKTR